MPPPKIWAFFTGIVILAFIGIMVLLNLEELQDALYALRTGYRFQWMPEGFVPGAGRALNQSGEVAASSQQGGRITIWTPGSEHSPIIGNLQDCNPLSASAINNRGSITGTCAFGAFFWRPETGLVEIRGTGEVQPRAINNDDQVVGWDESRAFYWDRKAGKRDLSVLMKEDVSFAFDINDKGWIVGGICSGELPRPALWKPDAPPLYMNLPEGAQWMGGAESLNEQNQVLMNLSKWDPGSKAEVFSPFLWTEEEGYEALPIPDGCDNVRAVGINDRGEILLTGTKSETKLPAAYFLAEGCLRELPPARRGFASYYTDLNNKGWMIGYIDLAPNGGSGLIRRQGFLVKALSFR